MYYESDHFRAVHASWDDENITRLRELSDNQRLTDDLLHQSAKKGTVLYDTVDETLQSKEMELPNGLTFYDKDGTARREVRIKWWENPKGHTIRSLAVGSSGNLPDHPVETSGSSNHSYYCEEEKPVFFGHYWLRGNPSLYRHNICCLDYSVVKKGKLVAYRFDGEQHQADEKLVFV